MDFEYKECKRNISDKELLEDLVSVAEKCQSKSLSILEYNLYGLFSASTIIRRFGSWNQALVLANMDCNNHFYTEEELFENMEKVWITKGSQPVRRDMDNKLYSDISSGAYARKYGKWSNALKEFVLYINKDTDEVFKKSNVDIVKHRTSRDVNLKLRFKVMLRDNFKCCICGASPAKDASVELHVDHIIPWSKGGETVMDNLQTLCSKCNWGKGNFSENE